VRKQFLPLLPQEITLEKLNEQLALWIGSDYHQRTHSSTGQGPLARYLAHLHLLRSAPKNLRDYFRLPARRKVDKDRTVTLNGKLYEAPVGLIGKTVTLLYDPKDAQRVEILLEEESHGFLTSLNAGINSRVRRSARQTAELLPPAGPPTAATYKSGSLFQKEASS
jgi:hypothetical protein